MDIWMIWAHDGYGHHWLVDAWDDDSTAENWTGWQKAVREAKADNDGRVVVVKSSVNFDKVLEAFNVPNVGEMSDPEVVDQ